MVYSFGMRKVKTEFLALDKMIKKAFSREVFVTERDITDYKIQLKRKVGRAEREWRFLVIFGALMRWVKIVILKKRRKKLNEEFVGRELAAKNKFFERVAAYPLDQQQRRAVVINAENSLVIAGAGAGKTMTIVAKIKYLVEILGVNPREILPISFTHKSAKEMEERIGVPGIKPQTFHAFGLRVIYAVEGKWPKIFDSEKLDEVIKEILQKLYKKPGFLTDLCDFLVNFLKIPKMKQEFKNRKMYKKFIQREGFVTLTGEKVGSVEKAILANFLTMNGVKFKLNVKNNEQKYMADFLVNDEIYIDICDAGKSTEVPEMLMFEGENEERARRRIKRSLERRRKKVEKIGGRYLVIAADEIIFEGEFCESCVKKLRKIGVEFATISEKEVWQMCKKNMGRYVDNFINLTEVFLTLMRGAQLSIDEILQKNKKMKQMDFLRKRAEKFLKLFREIYDEYENFLKESGQVDFDEMIGRAIRYIKNGDYNREIKYVIVDEFQDLSFGRYRILQAIAWQNPDVKFFCVGDDWQAIYRFAGSDIGLFTYFEKYFGKAEILRIENTYRFCEPVIGISSEFILKNPEQLKKRIKAARKGKTELILEKIGQEDELIEQEEKRRIKTESEKMQAGVLRILRKIKMMCDKEGKSYEAAKIFILGRYGFDLKKILAGEIVEKAAGKVECVASGIEKQMEYVTVHKSKGLEADFVILINCENGYMGFPSGRESDPLLNLVLGEGEEYEYAEERRLLYVAITRAKRATFMLVKEKGESIFLEDLRFSR